MLEVPLTPENERWLAAIAARVGEAPATLAQKALLAYMEDLEDYAEAVEAWKEFDPTTAVPLDDLMRRYGVED